MGLQAIFGLPGYTANQGAGPPVTIEGVTPTYSCTVTGFTPVASPTDVWNMFGSTTKTIRVTRMQIWATDSSAVQTTLPIQLVLRSTIGSVGSAALTAIAGIPHDSNDGAATAVVNTIATANYTTLGTLVGGAGNALRAGVVATWLTPETATDFPTGYPLLWDFTTNNERAIVLRGATQQIALNLAGATIVGTLKLAIQVTWIENNS